MPWRSDRDLNPYHRAMCVRQQIYPATRVPHTFSHALDAHSSAIVRAFVTHRRGFDDALASISHGQNNFSRTSNDPDCRDGAARVAMDVSQTLLNHAE